MNDHSHFTVWKKSGHELVIILDPSITDPKKRERVLQTAINMVSDNLEHYISETKSNNSE